MPAAAKKDVIAISGSAGRGSVLKAVLRDLPADLSASVFAGTHIPARPTSLLAEMLAVSASMPVYAAAPEAGLEASDNA